MPSKYQAYVLLIPRPWQFVYLSNKQRLLKNKQNTLLLPPSDAEFKVTKVETSVVRKSILSILQEMLQKSATALFILFPSFLLSFPDNLLTIAGQKLLQQGFIF